MLAYQATQVILVLSPHMLRMLAFGWETTSDDLASSSTCLGGLSLSGTFSASPLTLELFSSDKTVAASKK